MCLRTVAIFIRSLCGIDCLGCICRVVIHHVSGRATRLCSAGSLWRMVRRSVCNGSSPVSVGHSHSARGPTRSLAICATSHAAWPIIWAPAVQVVRETLNSRAAGNGDQGNASGVAQQTSQRLSLCTRPVRWWFDEGGLRSDRASLAWTCRVARSRACVSGWRSSHVFAAASRILVADGAGGKSALVAEGDGANASKGQRILAVRSVPFRIGVIRAKV
jgi:hypothetical protein